MVQSFLFSLSFFFFCYVLDCFLGQDNVMAILYKLDFSASESVSILFKLPRFVSARELLNRTSSQ